MTKAEQKKLEKLAKTEFIARIYGIVMESIVEHTKNLRSKLQVRISYQGNNRYIKLHFYGRDMAIILYQDGNVVVQLDEFAHSKHDEILFEYEKNKEQAEKFASELKGTLAWFIKVFIEDDVTDFHTYMDYVSDAENMEEAYKAMQEDWKKYEE